MLDVSQLNEAEVHYNLIDPQLKNARWNLADRTQISFEVPVDGYDTSPINDITDFCLYRNNGEILAVIEAKHTYRKSVEKNIEQLAQQHTTTARLKSGEKVSLQDLIALEETLETELSREEFNLTDDNILKAFGVRVGGLVDFLKFVLKLEALPYYDEIVQQAFDAFILEHLYNADQTRFLRIVQTVFMQKRKMEEADLYDAPFSNFGMNAVEKLFTNDDVKEIIELTKRLVA